MKGDPLVQQDELPDEAAAQKPDFVQFQNQSVGKLFL